VAPTAVNAALWGEMNVGVNDGKWALWRAARYGLVVALVTFIASELETQVAHDWPHGSHHT
jgi:hypothetical protein